MEIVIDRLYQVPLINPKETLGVLYLIEDNEVVFECKTLELPWKNNDNEVSCIPSGKYKVTFYNSPTKGEVLLLHNVPNRSMIEIHYGNYYTQILGCILVGKSHTKINNDAVIDISKSKYTLDKIISILKKTNEEEFDLKINWRS